VPENCDQGIGLNGSVKKTYDSDADAAAYGGNEL